MGLLDGHPRGAFGRSGLSPRGLRGGGILCGRAARRRNGARPLRQRRPDAARGRRFLHHAAPDATFGKEQISPARDSRLRWMQSVMHCTHYVAGAGEQAYLRAEEAPEITFVNRDPIDRSDEAYTEIPA